MAQNSPASRQVQPARAGYALSIENADLPLGALCGLLACPSRIVFTKIGKSFFFSSLIKLPRNAY